MSPQSAWRFRSVEQLCARVTSGGTPSRSRPDFYAQGTVPWIKTGELRDTYISDSEEKITASAVASSSAKLLPKDTVLMAMYGATVGALGVLGQPATCNQACCAMITDPELCEPRWLFYALLNDRDRIVTLATGAAQQNLSGKAIRQFSYLTPPIEEQRAIAEVLGALDDKIAANANLVATVDDLLASQFAALVTVSTSAVLSSIADVNVASAKPTAGGSLRYLDIASVGVGSYDFPGIMGWDEAPGRARRILRQGDTIWSTVRPNRRSHALVLDDDPLLIASTGLAVLTPKLGHFAFVYEATRTPQFTAYLESAAEGSAYPAVRADRFLNAPVPDVGVRAREDFESLAAPLRRRVHSAAVESRTLAEMRDALLPQLMSGKIRVRDAERVVEEVV